MASRYWVGGTASWDGTAGTKWALTSGGAGGQAVPTSADDVFFTNLSTGTCTVATGNTGAKSITCTGFTGTLTVGATISVAGSVTLVAGMTFSATATVTITGTGTITSGGKTFSNLTINGSGITVQLGDAFNASGALTVTAGTFTTSNFSVAALNFASSGSGTRTINLGSSTCTFSSTSTAWTTAATTNLTFNAGTSTLVFSGVGPNTSLGNVTFYNITFSFNTPNSSLITGSGATISGTLTLTAPASAGIIIFSFDSITIGTMVASGSSAVNRLFLKSITNGTVSTLNITTWTTISDIDFRDITLTNAKSPTRGGNCGNNTNITFPTAKTVYWNLTGTQNWSATAWATSSGGTPAINNFPLAQDTAVFNNSGAASTVTIDDKWNLGTFNASARTSAVTITTGSTFYIYGNYTLGSGVTTSGSLGLVFSGTSVTQDITTAGKTISYAFQVIGISNTVRFLDAFTSSSGVSGAVLIQSGTLNTNGFNVSLTNAASGLSMGTNGTKTLAVGASTITIAGTAGFNITATNTTITGTGTISLTSASAKTFDGDGVSFSGITLNQGGAGALTIIGSNTFGNITNSYNATGATSILFTAGTTSTFTDWNASGAAGKVLTISSVTAATHTLSKASGTVSADYLSLTNSIATGGATWYAGANSTDVSGNTGWIFTAPPSGNFFLLF